MPKKVTTAEFIERARKVHGDKYDYSQTEYVDAKTKVTIICPEHGPFTQKPHHHLDGHHCCECGRKLSAKSNTIPQNEFIKRAKKVHNSKYDYSKTEYVKMLDKVIIICPIHGEFRQTPSKHLQGEGCAKCARNVQLTTKEFISRSRDIHGDKYDYSKARYVNNTTKVVIGCPIHGDFKQSPDKHLSGSGCSECGRITTGRKKASTQAEFIDKARDIYGSRYDYSKVKYIRSNRKVTIICPEHGEFEKTPNKHLSGEGCPKCSGRYRRTADDFISDARKIHGNLYNYSKVDYKNTKTKVTITCPEHGDFRQIPELHLTGAGCPKCAGTEKLTTGEFIRRAKEVHGDRYDYSLVNYKNARTRVALICREHGEFLQFPDSHLRGVGCPKCSGNKPLTTGEFIEQAKAVHGDKYDYSEVKYVRTADKVDIICPVHGGFKQKPNHHLAGVGCPSCAHYGINTHDPGILYYVRVDTRTHTFWKIGITNRTVEKRFLGSDLKKITPIKIWPYKRLADALIKEQEIIAQHYEYLYLGLDQPLALGGNTELFTRDVLGLDKDYS